MADNFDLRQFLIENKLTKNTQLLAEGRYSDSYDSLASKKVHSKLRSIVDIFGKSYDQEIAELDAEIAAAEEETGTKVTPVERRVLQQQAEWIRTHDIEMEREGVEEGIVNEASYQEPKNSKEAQHLKKGDIIGSEETVVSVSAGAKTPKGKVEVTLEKDGKKRLAIWGKYTKIGVKEKETVKENAVKAHMEKLIQAAKTGDKTKANILAGFAGAGIKYKVSTAEPNVIKYWNDEHGLSGEIKIKETVKENTMTQREKYLTRLVENALGLQLNEALNKDIKAFGQDLDKNFKAAGFDTLILMQSSPTPEQLNIVKTNPKAAIFEVSQSQMAQMLIVRVNPKMISKAESIINKFQLSNYNGPVLQKGWTAKQVKGAINPGDIVKQDNNKNQGVWEFYRLAKVDTKVANVNEALNSKETVKESTMTTRERRLIEMVQKAMKENTDLKTYTYTGTGGTNKGHGHDIEQAQHDIERRREEDLEEGDEMAKETVIPAFNTVEELMKEIELRTKQTADQAKIKEMENIAEAMRRKLKGLEEGEHADHLDEKKLRDLRKNIGILDKTVMKLKTVFDKNYNKDDKKDKPASTKKEEEPATLAENKNTNTMEKQFDLKKFLVENKLTTNSRLLKENEELSYPFGEFGQAVKDIFENYGPEEISNGPDAVYELIAELIEEYDLDPMTGEIDVLPMEAKLMQLHKQAQTMDTEEFGEHAYNELSDASLFIVN